MTEEIIAAPEEIVQKAETEIGDGFWGNSSPAATKVETVSEPEKQEPAKTKDDEEEILDPTEWLNRELGINDIEAIKAEREELKRLKETPATREEIKFADEQSKLIHELIRDGKRKEVKEFLETQEQLETLSSLEVSDDNAEDIIKMQMKLKNKDLLHPLTPKEIDFEYKQNYSIPKEPKEPKQRLTETEDEFAERMDEYNEHLEDWKNQVANANTRKMIAAKLAQPELEKLKSQIVLPEIQPKDFQQQEPKRTQEDLDAEKKAVETFIQSVDTDLKNFNEISVTVKDEAVEIPVSYSFSNEEKAVIKEQLQVLAENNFNSNAVFAQRWVNDDNTLNVSRMIHDMAILNSEDKINQKFAQDAASKRLKEYTKEKKNIKLQGSASPSGQFEPTKAVELVEAAIWGA